MNTAKNQHRCVYIGVKRNSAVCYGQTGFYTKLLGGVNVEFYPDGRNLMFEPIVIPKEHVWTDTDGYNELTWIDYE